MKVKIKKYYKLISIITLVTLLFFNCLGRGDSPKRTNEDDKLISRFLHELGPENMKTLLASPYDRENPGIAIGDMIYMLREIPVEVMLDVVKGAGASNIAGMVNAVKRIGCNKNDDPENPEFDFGSIEEGEEKEYWKNDYYLCSIKDFNHLDILVSLIKGKKGQSEEEKEIYTSKLISMLSQDSLSSLDKDKAKIYIEKLAYLIVYSENTDSMINLINGLSSIRDVVYFVNKLDKASCSLGEDFDTEAVCNESGGKWYKGVVYPATRKLIDNKEIFRDLSRAVSIIKKVSDSEKLSSLFNGYRLQEDGGSDSLQSMYIGSKLIPLIQGPPETSSDSSLCSNEQSLWMNKLSYLVNNVTDSKRLTAFTTTISAQGIGRINDILCRLNSPDDTAPNNNAMQTMSVIVDEVSNSENLASIIMNTSTVKMANLLNDISSTSQTADDGSEDISAAGKKMAAVINNIEDKYMLRLADTIDTINVPEKLSRLIDHLSIAHANKLSHLVNMVSNWDNIKTILWDLNSPLSDAPENNGIRTMAYMLDFITPEKLVNLVETADGEKTAGLLNDISTTSQYADNGSIDLDAAGKKLANVIENIEEQYIDRLSGLINTIDVPEKLSRLIDYLTIAHAYKLSYLVNNVGSWDSVTNLMFMLNSPLAEKPHNNAIRTMSYMLDYVKPENLVSLIDNANGKKMADFLNDISSTSQKDDDGNYDLDAAGKKLAYLIDKIKSEYYIKRLTLLINNIDVPEKLSRLIDYLSISHSDKLAYLVNNVLNWNNVMDLMFLLDSPLSDWPNDNAVRTMGYTLDNVADPSKMVYLVNYVIPSQLSDLLNQVAAGSQWSDNVDVANHQEQYVDNPLIAGEKMVGLIDNTDSIDDIVFVLNAVGIDPMADLLNSLLLSSTAKVAALINAITGDNIWDDSTFDTRRNADGMGKLINLLNYSVDLSQTPGCPNNPDILIGILNEINDGAKLGNLVNYLNSNDLLALINGAIIHPVVNEHDFVGLINNLSTDQDMDKLAAVMNHFTPSSPKAACTNEAPEPSSEYNLVLDLLAPPPTPPSSPPPHLIYDPTVEPGGTEGIGYEGFADIIHNITYAYGCLNEINLTRDSCEAAGSEWTIPTAVRLSKLLLETNDPLCYKEDCSSSKTYPRHKGFVRMITYGVDYNQAPGDPTLPGVKFPPLGPVTIATLINGTSSFGTQSIIDMLNATTDLAMMVPLVGCLDHISDPDFNYACTQIGLGW